MADHTPPLEPSPRISGDLSLLAPPPPPSMVNGDGAQQVTRNTQMVILVQVNPGESFTIRREDGHIQCITDWKQRHERSLLLSAGGPAQVPMMSPNGSVPPIYVPPGYVSQIIEENGVRRVLVLPQPEFHPGSHSPLHPPTHPPLPAFIPHHAMMPPPHHHLYSTVSGAGDMGTQYIPQYHAPHVFSEQESHSPHGRPAFVHRDERTSKTYERLQKKLKERQGGGQTKDKSSSPPSSPQKDGCDSPVDIQNGLAKGQQAPSTAAGEAKVKQIGKVKGSPRIDPESEELDEESKALQALLSNIAKPVVLDIEARTAVLTWSPPSPEVNGESDMASIPEVLSYEVTVSYSGKDGKFKTAYSGEELSAALEDLRPATDYHARVQVFCNCLQGSPSEAVSFTTLSCEPDTPSPPRKTSGTKNTLVLQWKAPCDNGSKIQNYVLEWDEGKGTGDFEQCYYGPQKQHRVTKLSPASKYSFRLAAKNDMGISGFSEAIDFYTSGSVPATPASPELIKAGVTWLYLQWRRPLGGPSEDDISYILEMEEESSGYGFKPKYDGDELSSTIKNLRRSTKYRVRVTAYNSEGKSGASQAVEFHTCPDKPGAPCRPAVKGKVHANSFKMTWDAPKDDGGSPVTKYVVEMAEGTNGNTWEMVYSGSMMEHTCDHLKPGSAYQLRVYCISKGGQSPLSETLLVQTPAVPPGPCLPPRVVGKPRAREVQLRWGAPPVDGGSPVSCYSLEVCPAQTEEHREVYQGPELECTIVSLLPGRTYCFRLRAANKAGYGPFSERCEVTTAPGAPDQCKSPHVACKSPTCAIVSWEPPAGNGANVTEYRLEWGAAEGCMQICYSGPALSHEMKGLLPATTYFCRTQAVNVAGAGPFSEVVLCITPSSVPAAVSSLQAADESEIDSPHYCPSTCLALQWEPPCDHGSEITSYCIDLGDRQPIMVCRTNSYMIENLQPDTSYRIRIQALNSIGAGPFSHTIKLKTKPLPPQPPRLECTAFSHQNLKLKWGEGTAKALSTDSIQYHLQMEDRNGRFVSLYRGPCHTHKVQRLNESTSYKFRIQAFNEAGEGPFSTVYTFTTPRSSPAPLKAPRIEQLDDHSCEVTWEAVQPMKGDPIIYSLQSMIGNTEFKQIYRGPATSFHVSGLQVNCEYRFRACAIRQCQSPSGPQELAGPYSATVSFSSPRSDLPSSGAKNTVEVARTKRTLSDEQCAAVILVLFAIISILIAFVIQYFVIK
ncbi:fibronectin type-III domain-containing protein 3A isoform X3 [Lepisosteus oculatus]|uniref:fibronectin type-III domain-containing protein 3A isoform X3 n=1 Tax=Lepisosteus oculatus TaxID=7918 RepID=UPI003721C041